MPLVLRKNINQHANKSIGVRKSDHPPPFIFLPCLIKKQDFRRAEQTESCKQPFIFGRVSRHVGLARCLVSFSQCHTRLEMFDGTRVHIA